MSEKHQNRATPRELIGDLISSYTSVLGDPKEPHYMPGRDIVQRLLALLNQNRRCSNGPEFFQRRLTIRANTQVFLRPILKLNFVNTGQDSIYLGLKNSCISAQGETEPLSHGLPIDSSPGPLPRLGPICKPDEPFD